MVVRKPSLQFTVSAQTNEGRRAIMARQGIPAWRTPLNGDHADSESNLILQLPEEGL